MATNSFDYGNDGSAHGGRSMRIFIFKSDTNAELRAFGGDLAGTQLPSSSSPGTWSAPSPRTRLRRTTYPAK